MAAENSMLIEGRDITDKKKLEITGNLMCYELEAQARKKAPPAK